MIAAHEQKLSQTARKAHEENNLVQEKLEKQHIARRRRRKQTLRLTLSLAAVAVIAVAAVAWGIPALRYYNAQSLLSQARYDEARAAFAQMGSYGDAQAQLLRCDYLEALDALNAGDADSLMDAAERFLALQDYRGQSFPMAEGHVCPGQNVLGNRGVRPGGGQLPNPGRL